MKYIDRFESRRGAIPVVVWVAVTFLAIGGSTGGLLGFIFGGGSTTIKWFAYGIGLGTIIGIILIPNAQAIVSWWKGLRREIKK